MLLHSQDFQILNTSSAEKKLSILTSIFLKIPKAMMYPMYS